MLLWLRKSEGWEHVKCPASWHLLQWKLPQSGVIQRKPDVHQLSQRQIQLLKFSSNSPFQERYWISVTASLVYILVLAIYFIYKLDDSYV